MKLIRSLGALIQAAIYFLAGAILIALSMNLIPSEMVQDAMQYINEDPNLKLVLGGIGVLIILIGLVIINTRMGKMQMSDTIAFENPEGQVTVSLSAIEDFIKRSIDHMSEVRELRSKVTAGKKGISVECRATILAESNIPEITERIQNLIKKKVHDMLGVEEKINIKVHITKISQKGKGEQDQYPPKEHEESSRRMPFGE